MTLMTERTVNDVAQERRLVTPIPGPASLALHARKTAAVSNGVGVTLPVYVTRAGGGILVDADGNSLIDLGSGIAVTTVGNANPDVVAGANLHNAGANTDQGQALVYSGRDGSVLLTLDDPTPLDAWLGVGQH